MYVTFCLLPDFNSRGFDDFWSFEEVRKMDDFDIPCKGIDPVGAAIVALLVDKA